jgi:cyclic pyranopterin phosphate synthase
MEAADFAERVLFGAFAQCAADAGVNVRVKGGSDSEGMLSETNPTSRCSVAALQLGPPLARAMRNITHKSETLRRATAYAHLTTELPFAELLQRGRDDKGDALEIGRIAGIMAAKKTWETIPFCHPIPVTHAGVTFAIEEHGVSIEATCETVAQTGCEIEAMNAASVAALTVYDVLKPHSMGIVIDGIRLLHKSGGKSDLPEALDPPIRVGVVVTSDLVVGGVKQDTAGRLVRDFVVANAGLTIAREVLVGSDSVSVTGAVNECLLGGCELVLTVGGTGVTAVDQTVEAVSALLDRTLPGVMEAARDYGQRRTPLAMLSRGVSGVTDNTLVITIPGSTGGARDTMQALFPAVTKVVSNLRKRRRA